MTSSKKPWLDCPSCGADALEATVILCPDFCEDCCGDLGRNPEPSWGWNDGDGGTCSACGCAYSVSVDDGHAYTLEVEPEESQ